jgi:hypothetical protein
MYMQHFCTSPALNRLEQKLSPLKKEKDAAKRQKAIEAYDPEGPPSPPPSPQSRFKPEFTPEVEELCKLGITDADLCLFYNVSMETVKNWQKRYPEFFMAMLRGKQRADMAVAGALYKNAIGYDYYEHRPVKLTNQIKNADGSVTTREHVKVVKVKRHAKPDTVAQIFFLKNRRPDAWRDVTKSVEEDRVRSSKTYSGQAILDRLRETGHVMLEGEYEIIDEVEEPGGE